ncbi:MAG TPA: CDP-glycerol glycerophosphotransferase family protein [Candidatus Limnocylindrales bacterium]
MRRRLTTARAALVRAAFAIGRLWPLRPRVLLATAHADRLEGNLAAIQAGIDRDLPGADVVALAHRVRPGLSGALLAAGDALAAGWQLARASLVVVDDYFFPLEVIRKRPGTRAVQAWHACGAFKRFGYSVADKGFGADDASLAAYPIHANYDLCLVSAERFAPFYAEAFRQPLERFTARLGIPRTDVLVDPVARAAAEARVRARYRLPAGKRVVLYAPTFRGRRITEARSPLDLDIEVMRTALAPDHVLLVRAHPFVTTRLSAGEAGTEPHGAGSRAGHGPADPGEGGSNAGFVIDVSGWPELNELLLVSDVLVTDYSSAIYEFALLGRPIAFLTPDRAAYEDERGFYLRFPEDLPGPAFGTTAALAAWLRSGPFDVERVRQFAARSFDVADGHATARFVDQVVRPAVAGASPSRPTVS